MADPTPADILRPLRRVRQVRQFTPEPVDAEALEAIANVARWTGSSNNNQPWRFLLIRDGEKLRRLEAVGQPQTRAFATATAGIAIVLPASPAREIQDTYDDGRAAERMLIAASFLGLGAAITWIRADVRAAAAGILGLPSDRYVRTIVALGHPTEAALRPKSAPGEARLPRAEVVFADSWPGGSGEAGS